MMTYRYKKQSFIVQHILQHPYWYASLCAHAIVFLCLYYFLIINYHEQKNYVHTQEQQTRVSDSVEKTTTTAMQQQFKNLQKIKQLIEESTGKQPTNKTQDAQNIPTTPEEILAESKKLAAVIQAIEEKAKAEELAKILNIPEAEALKKIQIESTQSQKNKNLDDKKPELSLGFMEEAARNALAERQKQLERQKDGTEIKTDDIDNNKREKDPSANSNKNDTASKEKGEGDGSQKGRGHDSAQKQQTKNTTQSNNKGQGQQSETEGAQTGARSALNRGSENTSFDIHEKISHFLSDEIPLPETMSGKNYSTGVSEHGSIPEIFEPYLYKNTGLTIGEDGDASNRFYVNTWYLIGPFAGNLNRVYEKNPHYPPEKAIVLDAVYKGKNNRLLSWDYTSSRKYPLTPSILEEDSVYYGYTEIKVDDERDLWAWIGADDHVQFWLNNQAVYSGNPTSKWWFFDRAYNDQRSLISTWNLTETKQKLHFRKGTNKLFFKLSNGPEHVFFSMILTGE